MLREVGSSNGYCVIPPKQNKWPESMGEPHSVVYQRSEGYSGEKGSSIMGISMMLHSGGQSW
jgi:hypothetical protein